MLNPTQLDLEPSLDDVQETATLDRLQHDLRFVAATVAEIAASLPVQRRPLSDSTKLLHQRVTWLRRNGFCPACQTAMVTTADGKLPGAEFDHFYARHRPEPQSTWLICSDCNRSLEMPEFKATMRSAFESYQQALRPFLSTGQGKLFQ